jgi:hypothetical protein
VVRRSRYEHGRSRKVVLLLHALKHGDLNADLRLFSSQYGATPLHQLACLAGGSSLSRRPPRARDSPVVVTESSLSSSTSLASHRSLLPSVAEEAVEPSIAIDSPSGLIDTEQTKARACSTGGSTIKDGGGDRNRDARGKNPLTDEETERKLREIARRLIYDFDSGKPPLLISSWVSLLLFARSPTRIPFRSLRPRSRRCAWCNAASLRCRIRMLSSYRSRFVR